MWFAVVKHALALGRRYATAIKNLLYIKELSIMPRMATPTTTIASLSLSFVDAAGRTGVSGLRELTTAPTAPQILALQNAAGDASNAAVTAVSGTAQTVDNPALRRVFDEAYSGITEKLVIIFQNAARRTKKFELPAPDASMFASDGVTADYGNALYLALVGAIRAIIGTEYVEKRGFLSSRSRKTPTGNRPPFIQEPGTGDLPGIEPGLEP